MKIQHQFWSKVVLSQFSQIHPQATFQNSLMICETAHFFIRSTNLQVWFYAKEGVIVQKAVNEMYSSICQENCEGHAENKSRQAQFECKGLFAKNDANDEFLGYSTKLAEVMLIDTVFS